MEIRQLKTFKTVADLLSFNRAAETLNYALSSISAQILALEQELEVRLFDRLGRRILLTEAGERLLQYSEKILELADETRLEVTGARELQGTLTIRIPETFAIFHLPAIVKLFKSRHPKVKLRFITCAHEGLQQDLRKGITDLAFLLTDSIHAADLETEALKTHGIVLVAHPEHPLASKAVVDIADLTGETLILSQVDCSYRRGVEQILSDKNVNLGPILQLSSMAAIKRCVMVGIGLTILPDIAVAEEIANGELTPLPWKLEDLEVALLMIWYREKWLSPTITAFMQTAREALASPD